MVVAVHRTATANTAIRFVIATSFSAAAKNVFPFPDAALVHRGAFWTMAGRPVFVIIFHLCHIVYYPILT